VEGLGWRHQGTSGARIQGGRRGEGRQRWYKGGSSKGRRRSPALVPCGAALQAEGFSDRTVTDGAVAMARSDGGGVVGSALKLQAEYCVDAGGWGRGALVAQGIRWQW
jgi:hypothetical protein